MPRKSERELEGWTGQASDAEQQRYEWTKSQINQALTGGRFDTESFVVYPKGSYPNHTNVVRDSDVDVAVELTSIQQHEFIHGATGLTIEDFGLTRYTGDYSVPKFKDDVEAALRRQFGDAAVERGNKAIHVKESHLGLKADVVVCQTLKSHHGKQPADTRTGILIEPDQGRDIHNFPKHHLDEGVIKNTATSRRYKRLVRIVKRLENEMVANGVIQEVSSFLMESMVWNVPNTIFLNNGTWNDRLREALAHIYNADRSEWVEANYIKYLFHPSQGWTEAAAVAFIRDAWNYMEYN